MNYILIMDTNEIHFVKSVCGRTIENYLVYSGSSKIDCSRIQEMIAVQCDSIEEVKEKYPEVFI